MLGKKDIMDSVKKTFICSTFWSERTGFAAVLKTIEIMEKNKTWRKIIKIGNKIQKKWKNLFKNEKLNIKVNGIPSLSNFIFYDNHQKYKTFITQEMLKKYFIFQSNILLYCSHRQNFRKIFFKSKKNN